MIFGTTDSKGAVPHPSTVESWSCAPGPVLGPGICLSTALYLLSANSQNSVPRNSLLNRHNCPHLHPKLHPRPQPVDDRNQPVQREPPKIGIASPREIRRRNPCLRVRALHRQSLLIQLIGVPAPQVSPLRPGIFLSTVFYRAFHFWVGIPEGKAGDPFQTGFQLE